jgi:asparagine synthetase B (glutamine-hydrolysing)
MCGIAGIVGRTAVRAEAARRMNRLQVHRGPDDEGIWTSRNRRVVLGHTRLSIIDPTPSGHQPMTDGASAVTITFDGEIYNYLEIAERLRAEGVRQLLDGENLVVRTDDLAARTSRYWSLRPDETERDKSDVKAMEKQATLEPAA